ncbi:hypothetical protein SAMN06273572_1146 [Monaibacterium marinum]|uniref:Uncharacterized protein n=1 Tax=Pontivivens marinum TaxID=1690039 RepID=A0A2C9CWI0_9RHOB|nr:hypothetical protein [Monaibacterium marinum]SOH95637.1 hypothetical protein SAMN06273572_1146 [Monaibacterium marinum]
MPKAQTKFTVRMAPEALAQIDALRAQHGFTSRAAFLEAAGLAYGAESSAEDILRHLAPISATLHQLLRAADGELSLIKPDDVQKIFRELRKAMLLVRESLAP